MPALLYSLAWIWRRGGKVPLDGSRRAGACALVSCLLIVSLKDPHAERATPRRPLPVASRTVALPSAVPSSESELSQAPVDSSGNAATAAGKDADPDAGAVDAQGPCPLDADDPGAPIQILTAADAEAIGRAYSDSNETRIAHIDSLLRAGAFGPRRSGEARH